MFHAIGGHAFHGDLLIPVIRPQHGRRTGEINRQSRKRDT
jgi:hypothetical protein